MAENRTHDDPVGNEHDPSASTQMFRAFVEEGSTEPAQAPRIGGRTLAVAGGLLVVVALIAAFFLL